MVRYEYKVGLRGARILPVQPIVKPSVGETINIGDEQYKIVHIHHIPVQTSLGASQVIRLSVKPVDIIETYK